MCEQREPNPAQSMATRVGKMGLLCPLRKEKAESLQFKTNCALASFNTPFSLLTKTVDNADNKCLHLLMLILVVCLLQYLDSRVTMLGRKVCMATRGT